MMVPSEDVDRPVDIAVIGAGVAGLCLAIGLRDAPMLNVIITEASEGPKDTAGWVFGITHDSEIALHRLHPRLGQALDDAGGTEMHPHIRLVMGQGPDAGQIITEVPLEHPHKVVSRGNLLSKAREVDDCGSRVQYGKKLIGIEETSEHARRYHLRFSDGSSQDVDAVIGYDGVNSFTRSFVLGPDNPLTPAKPTGTVCVRSVISEDEATDAFGREFCAEKTQHGYVCDGLFLLTDWSDHGQSMQVVADWQRDGLPFGDSAMWSEWDEETLRNDLGPLGQLGQNFFTALTFNRPIMASTRSCHEDAPTYTRGAVCVVGDAAHAFQPHGAGGANNAIEDAFMLSFLLRKVETSTDVEQAFAAYDTVRRPLRQAMARLSAFRAIAFSGKAEKGLDLHKWQVPHPEEPTEITPDAQGGFRLDHDLAKATAIVQEMQPSTK